MKACCELHKNHEELQKHKLYTKDNVFAERAECLQCVLEPVQVVCKHLCYTVSPIRLKRPRLDSRQHPL